MSGLELSAAQAHDQHTTLAQADVEVGSLQLRDLGYFSRKHFARQIETGRYFLSRLKANTKLYRLDGRPLAWTKLLLDSPDDQVDLACA